MDRGTGMIEGAGEMTSRLHDIIDNEKNIKKMKASFWFIGLNFSFG